MPKLEILRDSRSATESLDGGRVKGGMLRAHLDWAIEQHGKPALIEITNRLSAPLAATVRKPILASEWHPFRSLIEIDRAIVAVFGGDEAEVLAELGRSSARKNLEGTYKAFVRKDPMDFFRQGAILHSRFQDFGVATLEERSPTACIFRVTGAPCFARTYCYSAIGYFEEALRMHHVVDPRAREETCLALGDDSCSYRLRWL